MEQKRLLHKAPYSQFFKGKKTKNIQLVGKNIICCRIINFSHQSVLKVLFFFFAFHIYMICWIKFLVNILDSSYFCFQENTEQEKSQKLKTNLKNFLSHFFVYFHFCFNISCYSLSFCAYRLLNVK
jgi:hypothetical protein